MPLSIAHAGVVEINGHAYRLIRTSGQQGDAPTSYSYKREYVNEPPFSPSVYGRAAGTYHQVSLPVSDPQETWHMGGFKSRPGIDGTSEYGQNTDGRFPNRLLPGPLITQLTLTSATDSVQAFFEALGYVWVVTPRYVYRITPGDDTVTTSKDFTSSVFPLYGFRWENDFGIIFVTGDAASKNVWKVTAIGSPDIWTQTADAWFPTRSAAGINRLFVSGSWSALAPTNILKNLSTALDPLDKDAYADSVQIGDQNSTIGGMVPYDRSVLVGKNDGVFGIGEEGFGVPLIKRFTYDPYAAHGMINFDPYVLIPHPRGLYRWQPGQIDKAGIEVEILNESPIRGRIWSLATDGNDVYVFMTVSGNNGALYIVHGRERRSSEQGFGPFIWDTIGYLAAPADGANFTTFASWVSNLSSTPRLYFGYGKKVAYIKLSAGGGAPDVSGSDYSFATSGNRYTVRYNFNDWGQKDFYKVVIVAKNCDANNYWKIFFSIDGGSYSDLDINGNEMKAVTNGRLSYELPLTAQGVEIQYRLDYVYDGSGAPPELNYFEPFAVQNPRNTPLLTFYLLLAEGVFLDQSIDDRSATDQYSDLESLLASVVPFSTSGPWGENVYGTLQGLNITAEMPQDTNPDEIVVMVQVQVRSWV